MPSWSYIKFWIGKAFNVAGLPAIISECDYRSDALNSAVRVRKAELFTIVSVNGVDVYFSRFTGKIDGVGSTCCQPGQPSV